jgi:lambda repressor-like predicted transcriptional regulator
MHPEQIKAEIRMKGLTSSAIADELHRSRMAVSNVIHGRVTSRAIASRIAKAIGMDINQIWPGKYLKARKKRAQARRQA